MFPDQQNPYGPPQPGPNQAPQQHASGQYEVVPPPQAGPNTGHTGHNPYEFIMNPPAQRRRSLFGGGNNFVKKIVVLVGGAVLLMVIAAIVLNALGPKSSTPGLTDLAEQQQEIVRVATAVVGAAGGQDTKNFAANTSVSVASDQAAVLDYLGSHGTKLSSKQLAADQNAQTDTLLTNAASANTYDTTAVRELTSELQAYQRQLNTTYKQTTKPEVKQLLQHAYSASAALLTQAKSVSN